MYYVMSDIHGSYNQMNNALKYWDSNKEHLVVMGDLINKGPDSLKVVRKLMTLKESYPDKVTILKGNHEEMFVNWLLNTPHGKLDEQYRRGFNNTFKSFIGLKHEDLTSREKLEYMLSNYHKEVEFLDSLPLYLETDNVIFVHAGINLNIDNWKDDERYMLWEINDFICTKKTPEKRVFFGHVQTRYIHEFFGSKDNYNIWISNDRMKVGIDGSACDNGQLNAIKVDNRGNIVYSVFFV